MSKNPNYKFPINDGTDFIMNYEVMDNLLPATTLFIHGNLASNRWWYPTQDAFLKQNKTAGFTGKMISAEFRGCGQSSAPKTESEVSMNRLADDFIALVKANTWGKINLVGHSTGGLIAGLMLAKAPELFNKAVFLDPVGAKGVTFHESMTVAFEQMKNDKGLVSVVMASTIYANDEKSDFFRQVVVEDAFSAVSKVGVLILKALDGLDTTAQISSVKHPVLVLHGEHDQLLPMADSKQMAALMKNGHFEVIVGHGHCTNVEDPALFVQMISNFLFKT